MLLKLIAPAAASVAAAAAFAQSDTQSALDRVTTPPVEIEAYRVPVRASETAQGVSVITAPEIADRRPASTIDLLQQLPGVHVDQSNPGGVASVYIRGSDPEQTVVLVDGVRVNDPMLSRGGSYDLSSLDPASIERIEVLRGGGSAMYGADAMGGVINIITRRPENRPLGVTIGGGYGGEGYASANAQVGGRTESVQYSVSAARLKDGKAENGGTLDLNTFAGSLGFKPTESVAFDFFARHNEREGETFPDTSGGPLYAAQRTLEQRNARETNYGGSLSVTASERAQFKVQLTRYERDESIANPGVPPAPSNPFNFVPPANTRSDFVRTAALATGSFRLPLDSDLTLGYENMREEGTNRGTIFLPPFLGGATPSDFSLSRSTSSPFLALKSKPLDNVVVMVDLRHDTVSGLDSEFSPAAGVRVGVPGTDTAFKARYAEGFRPPSFFALSDPVVGNPNLVSETSSGWEAGVEQIFWRGRAQLDVTAFTTRFKNLIDFDPNTFRLVNRSTVDAQGVETSLRVQPTAALLVALTYTYTDTEIVNSTDRLRNRPRNRGSVSLRYAFSEALSFTWNSAIVGQVYDFSIPTGNVVLESYSRTDVALSYRWQKLTATVAVDNLFNEHYQAVVGFPNPGVRLRAMLSASF
jgi:outer membrane cobalamin receptor